MQKQENRLNAILIGTQEQNAGMSPWGMQADIAKAFVRCHEKPMLTLNNVPEWFVLPSSHRLVSYSWRIMTSSAEQSGCTGREVFIHFELQRYAGTGKRGSVRRTSAA